MKWRSLFAAAACATGALGKNDKVNVDIEIVIDLDSNATTTTTSHNIVLVPEVLVAPSPFPAPAPNGDPDVGIPILPAPHSFSPSPGPEGLAAQCDDSSGCQSQSCDDFDSTACSVLEKNFGCDCGGCACALDKDNAAGEYTPAPAPLFQAIKSGDCPATCVDEGASCDYWEFNTCDFLESSKGCDCSGCACTGGSCESDKDDDSDTPECEAWCGNTLSQWESCEYCRCKACDFCVVAEDGETALEQSGDPHGVNAAKTVSLGAAAICAAGASALWFAAN